MKYKLMIFDFDFTLADSSSGIIRCVNYALDKLHAQKVRPELIKKCIGMTLKNTYLELSGDTDKHNAERFHKHFVELADEIMVDSTIVYQQIYSLLSHLHKAGIKMAIVSTKYRYRIEAVLKREKLLDFFEIIVGGEDVSNMKPDPEGMLKVVKTLNFPKNQILFIGDTLIDEETAVNAGIDFAAVTTGTTQEKEFSNYPVYIFKDVRELLKIL